MLDLDHYKGELDAMIRLVEQMVAPAFLTDMAGRIVAWNKACSALTSMSREVAMASGEPWRAFSHEKIPSLSSLLAFNQLQDVAHYFEHYQISEHGQVGLHAQRWFAMPLLGEERYLEIDACVISDSQTQPLVVLETFRDMTARERARQRFRRLFESSPDPVWIIEGNQFVDCNDAAVRILGYQDRLALLNTHPSKLSPSHQPDGEGSFEKAEKMMAMALSQGLHRFEWVHQRADGSVFDAEVTLAKIELEGQQAIYCTWRDISERKKIQSALSLYATVFQHSGEAIVITDSENRIVAINDALARESGYTQEELKGKNPRVFASGMTPPETYQQMWEALKQFGFWQGELWDQRKDGTCYPKWTAISVNSDADGRVINYFASYTDMSAKKASEEKIAFLAHHDTLTGLLNRHSLENRLAQALAAAKREERVLALVFLDLDRFKDVNDTLGHQIGDQLLIEVAQRLSSHVRASDIVARLGGDEFVIGITGDKEIQDVHVVVEKLQQILSEPYQIAGKSLHVTPSMGISLFPQDGQDAMVLMKHADTAMYFAKDHGRNNFQFFQAEMTSSATEKLELQRDLARAIELGQLELHYQPQVRTQDQVLSGMEALLRWHHPTQGMIPPLKFIPIAEESGLILLIGAWVIEQACRQLADWHSKQLGPHRISVNLSVHQLRSPHLLAHVRDCLQSFAIERGCIEMEITESAAMQNPQQAIGQLQALRELGVALAIDDFGTGYSSLAYLKLLPIQTLKLDRAFVRDIETDENDAAISIASIALAHNLGLQVVAEGVENEAQRAFLQKHHCDFLQGYFFGKPAPAAFWEAHWLAAQA